MFYHCDCVPPSISMLLNFRRGTIAFETRVSLQSSLRCLSTTPLNPLTKPELKTLVLTQYSHGKFYNLIRNVIASPSVLLRACQNITPLSNGSNWPPNSTTLDSVSNRFSIEELSRELGENRFDLESCCITILPSRRKGECLVIPNLKLKVVIEAVRIVLEVVYDDRFVTFAYGGRVGMGRHTAIRYLKNSVQNPSWWFTIALKPEKFDNGKVGKLVSVIKAKIEDKLFTDLLERMFNSEALKIELGGCYLGRGFPQECSLSSILVNIYFDGFDKEIQDLRLQIHEENPKLETDGIVLTPNAFYKPKKIYAVRYLDEILIITSGPKMLAMDFKNQVVKFLEKRLILKVDRIKTAIHSAVTEKIDFLGMELQAVSPSVLHPPMSEKAIRARKKYLRQKEVKQLELKNARETNRKKLGLKILSHVYKKLKRGDGFKFDIHIENEVRHIFKTWGHEVVKEIFESLEERWNWHHLLSAGDFLSLRNIRNQLPQELIDAYDEFQEQVETYLNPNKARKILEQKERKTEEEEERKYAERTVDDLTRLCMKVSAPIELVRKAVKLAGFTNNMGRPRPIKLLIPLEDTDIIKWYAGVGKRWLDFFSCCRNFRMVKTVVTYHLRFSCLLTLAEKHESTKREAIRHYTKDLKVVDLNGTEEVHFPSENEIKMMGDNNLSDPKPVDGALTLALIRLASDECVCGCAAHFCDRIDTILYRIRLLQNRLNVNPLDENKWVRGMGVIHESMNKKCLPLCSDHSNDLFIGKISLQDIDCTSIVDVH